MRRQVAVEFAVRFPQLKSDYGKTLGHELAHAIAAPLQAGA